MRVLPYTSRLTCERQILIGKHAAMAGIIVVLLMPMWKYISVATSFLTILEEPEQFGMFLFFLVGSWLLHTPLVALLCIFRRGIARPNGRLTRLAYVLVLALFAVSAAYYCHHSVFPREYRWARCIPALVYFLLLVLPLSLGYYGWKRLNALIRDL